MHPRESYPLIQDGTSLGIPHTILPLLYDGLVYKDNKMCF